MWCTMLSFCAKSMLRTASWRRASGGTGKTPPVSSGEKVLRIRGILSHHVARALVQSANKDKTRRKNRGQTNLFECIRTEMQKGSPEGYNAETGLSGPAQKPE